MKRLAVLAALLAAAPAPAAVRTLFVGIDDYANAAPAGSGPPGGFYKLQGSVGDALLVRQTLIDRYKLTADDYAPGRCPKAVAPTMTLTDRCATRAAMLGALIGQVAAAAPGDIVLFFYAGHGSTSAETGGYEQATGSDGKRRNSTILSVDARGGGVPDILDVELRDIIDHAAARGVGVVTIFDSCHSGTATRDTRSFHLRDAPEGTPVAREPLGLAAKLPPRPFATPRPIRVHLAAAGDAETAKEVPWAADGQYHGLFTTALVKALAAPVPPTYADLIGEIRRNLGADSQIPVATLLAGSPQTVQAEGSLKARFLGGPALALTHYAARRIDAGHWQIDGGALAGVTPGSIYRLFGSLGDAETGARPLGTGTVTEPVTAGHATLTLQGKAIPPDRALVAAEQTHAFGADTLALRIDATDPAERARIAALLADVPGVTVTEGPDAACVLVVTGATASLVPVGNLDRRVGSPLDPRAPNFRAALVDALGKIGHARALLALRGSGDRLAEVEIAAVCDEDRQCPDLPQSSGETLIPAGTSFQISVLNIVQPPLPLYTYAFYVDADYGVMSLLVPEGAQDPPLRSHDYRSVKPMLSQGDGHDQIVVVLTDRPVDLSAFEQDAVRDAGLPKTRLEALLRAARAGRATRDAADFPEVGTWGAIAVPVRRVPAGVAR